MRTSSFVAFALFALAACGGAAEAGTPSGGNAAETPNGSGSEATGRACGGIAGIACAAGEFCDLGASCHTPDAMGTCSATPQMCTREYRPVCGCDGRTYPTACVAHSSGASVLHDGECASEQGASEEPAQPQGQSCGSRGQAQCPSGTVCIRPVAAHCGETDAPGTCQARPQICTMNFDPVCGCNGHTYSNACQAAAAGESVRADGPCP